MGNDFIADIAASIDFLHHFRPEGPWVITAIKPEKKGLESKTFLPGQEDALVDWIKARPTEENIYFSPNPLRWEMNGKGAKAKKTDVKSMDWLHTDLDPRPGEPIEQERERALRLLREFDPPPTVIIDSGGGYQGFWKLDEPQIVDGDEKKAIDLEGYNLQIEVLLGADSVHNLDRVMRLVGTLNVPGKNKLAKGRKVALATVVEADWSRIYPLSRFKKAARSPGKTNGSETVKLTSEPFPHLSLDELPAGVSPRMKMVIVQGNDPDKPYRSRSEAVWAVLCEMVRAGCSDDQMAGVILDKDFLISAHVLEQKRPRDYAAKQISKAKTEAPKISVMSSTESPLAILNRRHAVLLQEAGKTRVLSWEVTELDGGRVIPVLQSFEDFRNRYMNRFVDVQTPDGEVKRKPWGRWWLEHGHRREYLAFRFLPGEPEEIPGAPDDEHKYLNLWRGFSVEPAKGDWSLMKAHIESVLAADDSDASKYIIKWAAYAIQHPDEPAEVALVFKGKKGCGKGVFGRTMRSLFGQHGFQINSSKHLTGNFNAHLRDCCLLFADEAIVPGDKNAESILKGLITEPELAIEGKGVNLVQERNRLHVVMASNHDWVVPATIDERRFAIFDVPDWRIGDRAYFSALYRQLGGEGRAAMLHDLKEMDLGDWHPRQNIPKTEARYKQIAASFHGIDKVMFDILRVGEIPVEEWVTDQRPFVATSTLQAYVRLASGRSDISANAVANLLGVLGAEKDRSRRPSGYIMQPLTDTRLRWGEEKVPYAWGDLSEQWTALPGGTGVLALREHERNGVPPPKNEPPF